jgi:uncharacterized protein YigE (DUF2233 family)
MIGAALALVVAVLALPAVAQDCRDLTHEGNRYSLCEVDVTQSDLRLFLYDDTGAPFGQFSEIEQMLAAQGKRLGFAMNAGMYHSDRAPVGHYVEAGNEIMRVVPGAGPGNFGLVPNGVFCMHKNRAEVIETTVFLNNRPICTYATQSGPMLVIDGALHPRFLIDSTSRYVRNGVGTTADGGRAFFVISSDRVTFHEFGSLFRDVLNVPNALYLDGNISRLHAPQLGRSDLGFAMGPIVGTVVGLDPASDPSN